MGCYNGGKYRFSVFWKGALVFQRRKIPPFWERGTATAGNYTRSWAFLLSRSVPTASTRQQAHSAKISAVPIDVRIQRKLRLYFSRHTVRLVFYLRM
eukprot:4359107-Pleurochrysis_carterae.AAC.1